MIGDCPVCEGEHSLRYPCPACSPIATDTRSMLNRVCDALAVQIMAAAPCRSDDLAVTRDTDPQRPESLRWRAMVEHPDESTTWTRGPDPSSAMLRLRDALRLHLRGEIMSSGLPRG